MEFEKRFDEVDKKFLSQVLNKVDQRDYIERLAFFKTELLDKFQGIDTQVEQLSRKSTRLLKEISDCKSDYKQTKSILDRKVERDESAELW